MQDERQMFGRPHQQIAEMRKTGSLPNLLPPPKYLTKNNDTSEFHHKLRHRVDKLTENKRQMHDRMAEIREILKQKQEQEHLIISERNDRKKLLALIPVYRDMRDLKKELLSLHVESQEVEKDLKRVSSQEKAISTRQEVFKLLNIPSARERPSDVISPTSTLRQITSGKSLRALPSSSLISMIEKPVDKKRLNLAKLGLYREWVGASMDARITFARKERIFPPLDNIVRNQKQHLLDRSHRLKEVAQNRKEIDDMILKTRLEKKFNKEAGIFTTARSSLYPFSEAKSLQKLDLSRMGSSAKRGERLGSQGSLADILGRHSHKSSYNMLGALGKD